MISPNNTLSHWQKIQVKGELIWMTRPSPLTYYNSLDGIIGLEYDIINEFCKANNIKLVVKIAKTNKNLFTRLNNNSIDLAGANLALTSSRKSKYTSTHYYDETYTRIISSARKGKITSLNSLKSLNGAILNNSSYVPIAKKLIKSHDAKIDFLDGTVLYQILQKVVDGSLDYTLSDSNIINIFGSYIPKLRTGQKVSKLNKLVFLIPPRFDDSLKKRLDKFILDYKKQNKVKEYKKYLRDLLPNSRPADTVNFLKNYRNRWPKVKDIIYATAKKYDISPILLGAISYQESHWHEKAVSPTQVKGLMMLTKAVAEEQGVTDRFNPRQSLEGGTEYLLRMIDKVPDRITDPDRTNFALAGYNLGYGYLERARVLTQRSGKNPDLWEDVKLFLPKLNDIEDIKADGATAVRYVENIHIYQKLLQWKEQNK